MKRIAVARGTPRLPNQRRVERYAAAEWVSKSGMVIFKSFFRCRSLFVAKYDEKFFFVAVPFSLQN
jgi:hypothetical protein